MLLATAVSCGLNKLCGQTDSRKAFTYQKNSQNWYTLNKQVSSGVVQDGLVLFGRKDAMQSRCCGLTDKPVLVKMGHRAYTT